METLTSDRAAEQHLISAASVTSSHITAEDLTIHLDFPFKTNKQIMCYIMLLCVVPFFRERMETKLMQSTDAIN